MNVMWRAYGKPDDFERVGAFLIRHYQPLNKDGNWLQPAWEYMHSHPMLDETALKKIGIWEDGGEIVAVAHYESRLGEVFCQLHPDYRQLLPAMVEYAETHLTGVDEAGQRFAGVYVNGFDTELAALLHGRGYEQEEQNKRQVLMFAIPAPFPPITLPRGYRLQSLADKNDLHKVHRVLWRGFNHPGEPAPEELPGRQKMQSGPNFRHDLTIVVVAPNDDYVSFCGMWLDGTNKLAYVEPVATDPDYRRLGLGKAAVYEGIRRCGEEGAAVAYVGSDLPFYLALEFEKVYDSHLWLKTWAEV